ncbi:hypothetical protein FB563_6733 [Streptomyces puniciscabiei]|uniref:Uncharacterized protein n=1 Tax=Streptomyces puniciscabiei TaxID=164348 RepID=A0A542TIB7_9ACTN|nr:hypothetical protein [Streptomyces puniciscabiei]TQK86586.1 hypothetical protein FB563_6733 [Streptomyces puniciscabiei]
MLDDEYSQVDEVSLAGLVVRDGHGAVLTALEWAFRILTPVGELVARGVRVPDEDDVDWSTVVWVLAQRRRLLLHARLVPVPGQAEQPLTLGPGQSQPGLSPQDRGDNGRGTAVDGPPQRCRAVRQDEVGVRTAVDQRLGDPRVVPGHGLAQHRKPLRVPGVGIRPLRQQLPHRPRVPRPHSRDEPAPEAFLTHAPSPLDPPLRLPRTRQATASAGAGRGRRGRVRDVITCRGRWPRGSVRRCW